MGIPVMEQNVKRRLAAIFSADVKGYSHLMRDDEVATINTLTEYRELMTKLIQQHHGRVVDSPGDNLLAEFSSVVDAVQSAVAIQKELTARNDALPDTRKMEFRIGINLGDVIVDEGRIYGDGVNIAARLEGLAQPGGICVSRTAFDQIEDKLPFGYEYLGAKTVKNISKPLRAYRVLIEPDEIARMVSEESRHDREATHQREKEKINIRIERRKERALRVKEKRKKRKEKRAEKANKREIKLEESGVGTAQTVSEDSPYDREEMHQRVKAKIHRGKEKRAEWAEKKEIGLEERNARRRARGHNGFPRHLRAYVGVIGLLLIINVLTYKNTGTVWFYWPGLCWGLGLYLHWFNRRFVGDRKQWGKLKRGFLKHLGTYVGVISFLLIVNLLTYSHESRIWFHWPALVWGLFLFMQWKVFSPRSSKKDTE